MTAQPTKNTAKIEARTALVARDFRRACEVVARYEAGQSNPRGMGIDWTHDDVGPDVAGLAALFDRWPRRLAFVPEASRDAFRMAAADAFLWGLSRPSRDLDYPDVEGPLDADVVCSMLLAFAQTEKTLHVLRADGYGRVAIMRDGSSCAGCQSGPEVFDLAAAPEIPRPECTNPEGCRCALRPATRDE